MNEFLADMYGTRETIGAPSDNTDVEKLAEAQLLDEALQAEGIDIDQLPGETILKLAYQILGEDSHLVKAAQEEAAKGEGEGEGEGEGHEETETPAEEKKEESMEEKVAQADFLGRVMAHSYVNELDQIEKTGAPIGTETAARFASSVAKARSAARNAAAYGGSAQAGKGLSGGKSMGAVEGKLRELLFKAGPKAKAVGKHLGEHKGKYIAGGAAGAAGAAGGFAAGKKKKASALEELAEKRAMQWARDVGLVEEDPNEKLAAAVDARAYEMLREQGIDVDAIEAALAQG